MANNVEKKWNKPWSMEEMIENAETWSLAGDVALLNTLKTYADNLFTRSVGISNNVNDLLHSLDEVSLKLDISQNQFQSLRNTQFIESRVYEDDETLDIQNEAKPETPVPSEEDKEQALRDSVLEGLNVMDKYFEKVEVSISDSEDDESDNGYILRPKDIYAHRPLPLVIGTEKWYKKWHVGLADSSTESESENVSDNYSESESGDDLPKDLIRGSETSSELDISSQTSDGRPVANSTFNDSTRKPNVFASSEESDEQGSLPVKTPISSKTFAEQLAAKLGDVVTEREDISAEINKKPIQPATNKFADVLFSDEPPPLDDLDDTILPKSAQQGLFSGGQGLFDDNEDEPLWSQHDKRPNADTTGDTKRTVEKSEEKVPPPATHLPKSFQVSRGLFDSDSDTSEPDLFSTKPPVTKPFLQPYTTTAPLFDNEPPELETSKKPVEETKKKPIGGVSIFGKSDLFSGEDIGNVLKSRQQDNENKIKVDTGTKSNITAEQVAKAKPPNLFDDRNEGTPKKISLFGDEEPKPAEKPKKVSLFDDDDELFKDDLFASITTNKFTSNLFDPLEKDTADILSAEKTTPKTDLFGGETETVTVTKPKKPVSLFDDINMEEEEDELFSEKLAPVKNPIGDNIVSRIEVKVTEVSNLIDEAGKGEGTKDELAAREAIVTEKFSSGKKPVRGLFDDSEGEDDTENLFTKEVKKLDVFGTGSSLEDDDKSEKLNTKTGPEKSPTVMPPPDPVLEASSNTTEKSQISKNPVNLFGSTPPSDDDDWDTKSDHFSDTDDQFSYRVDYNTATRSSLFDNEPPSLGPNESSGIVRDQNTTRIDTDDSFNPYASSSRRFSSEVFSEQQSQDSFFVTKNRSESVHVPATTLGKIPEIGTTSNLEITPSGDPEDFDNSGGATNDSVFRDSSQPEPSVSSKKPVSLFDDELNASGDSSGILSVVSNAGDAPKLSSKRLSLFEDLGLGDALDRRSGKEEKNADIKQSVTKEESVKTAIADSSGKDATKPPTGSPGKLKHNLKINVNALMPGAAPPKLREMTKSHSLDLPSDPTPISKAPSSPNVGFYTPLVSSSQRNLSSAEISSERAVSFDDAVDGVEVLQSVTKDRARIPIKRRPSTRRGRRQAIESATSDTADASGAVVKVSVEIEPTKSETPVAVQGDAKSNVFDFSPPSPKEEFKTPPIHTPVPEANKVGSIFDDINKELSPSEPVTIKKAGVATEQKPKSSIFDSGDSDEELFGQPGSKKSKKESTQTKKTDTGAVKKKKSLFNDSSSDEDLFSTSSGDSKRRGSVQKTIEKKPQKLSTTKKLENIQTDEDPLSLLLK